MANRKIENFSQGWWLHTIKKENKFYTACGDGKAPFICANDIASIAFWCLTTNQSLEPSYRALGGELLTFDEVSVLTISHCSTADDCLQIAQKLSNGTSRDIEHVKVSQQEVVNYYMNAHWPEQGAYFMSWIESRTAEGKETMLNDAVQMATGRSPLKFDGWLQENKTYFE